MDHTANPAASNRRALLAGIGGVAAGAFLGAGGRADAAPPPPPPGPPGPTMKRLDEIEPRIPIGPETTPGTGSALFAIQQPGSYYLTGDIVVPSGATGILIRAGAVRLDLMGFAVRGLPGSVDGIANQNPPGQSPRGQFVCNGVVEDIGRQGLNLFFRHTTVSRVLVRACGAAPDGPWAGAQLGQDAIIEDCIITGNAWVGLIVAQRSRIARCQLNNNAAGLTTSLECVVSECEAMENSGSGMSLEPNCVADRVAAHRNGAHGFIVRAARLLSQCAASNNGQEGFEMSLVDRMELVSCTAVSNGGAGFGGRPSNASFVDCMAANNQGEGFRLRDGCAVRQCTASDNSGRGIEVGDGSSVAECVVRNNQLGVHAGDHCGISGNTVAGNSGIGIRGGLGCSVSDNTVSGNSGVGIQTGQECSITGNSLAGNSARGIDAGSSCRIEDNRLTRNSGGGIRTTSDGSIIGNHLVNNRNAQGAGPGIRIEGAGNRVERNHLILNSPGLQVTGGSNLIIGNSARANTTNYSVAGGNTVGPFVNSGSIGTSNNPHSNYDF